MTLNWNRINGIPPVFGHGPMQGCRRPAKGVA